MSNEFLLQLLTKLKSSVYKELAGCYVELIYNNILYNICIEDFAAFLQFCLPKTCIILCQGVFVSLSVFTLSNVLMTWLNKYIEHKLQFRNCCIVFFEISIHKSFEFKLQCYAITPQSSGWIPWNPNVKKKLMNTAQPYDFEPHWLIFNYFCGSFAYVTIFWANYFDK